MGEVLPYLEVNRDNEKEEDIKKEVVVPNIEGMTGEEAEKILKDMSLQIQYSTEEKVDKKAFVIQEQLPKSGIKVYEGTKIFVN